MSHTVNTGNAVSHKAPVSKGHVQPRAVAAALVFTLATLACVVFSFGLIPLPTIPVVDQTDSYQASYTGALQPLSGEFTGLVEIRFAQGDSYEGTLEEGRFTGEAVYQGNDWKLSGCFTEGRLNGEGIYEDIYGTYRGNFTDSLPDGEGEYTSKEGWVLRGTFRLGVIAGEGSLTLSDGTVISGRFENGVLVSA